VYKSLACRGINVWKGCEDTCCTSLSYFKISVTAVDGGSVIATVSAADVLLVLLVLSLIVLSFQHLFINSMMMMMMMMCALVTATARDVQPQKVTPCHVQLNTGDS